MSEEFIIDAVKSASPFFNDHPQKNYITGKFYLPELNFSRSSAVAVPADTINYIPFIPDATHTFTGIVFLNTLTTESGEKVRLGIYAATSSYLPGSLVLDAGEVTLDATSALRDISISQSLTKDTLYFLAYVGDNSTSIVGPTNGYLISPPIFSYGLDTRMISISSVGFAVFTEAHTYAALPATAGADGINSTTIPLIFMKG